MIFHIKFDTIMTVAGGLHLNGGQPSSFIQVDKLYEIGIFWPFEQ